VGEKIGHSRFNTIISVYVALGTLAFFIQIFAGSGIIIWLPLLFSFFYALSLRMYLVKRDNIATDTSSLIAEFCCGFWCFPCSIAQSKNNYNYNII
jgi:hypothetical protein